MKFFNFTEIKHNLTEVGNKEPLNWFSILVLIALDIFIVVNLFQALAVQTAQITRPNEKYPYQCKNAFDSKFNKNNSKLSMIESIDRGYINFGDEFNYFNLKSRNLSLKTEVSEKCLKLGLLAKEIKDNDQLGNLINKVDSLERKINDEQYKIERVRSDYDTNLLEKIAGQEKENSITENDAWKSKKKIQSLEKNIKKWQMEVKAVQSEILSNNSVQHFFNYISDNRNEVLSDYESLSFWYSLKVWFFRLVFLIPLFLIFWFLYHRASRKGSSISTLIYSHALAITTIPIFWGILEFIYDLLPKKFLDQFLGFLKALNLEVLIFPLMILGGILGAMFLIYIVQKKLFNKKKTQLKRISKEQCPACGMHVSEKDFYCYNCGEAQYLKCQHCGNFTKKEGLYCIACGEKDFKSNPEV